MNPLVTIYIPTKNRLELLRRAVNSVLNQTYRNFELIVIDDGSTDGTQEYLLQMQEKGQLYAIFMPVSMGACVARNFAISKSKGDFLTGLDDDDYFLPERLQYFLEYWRAIEQGGGTQGIAGLFDSLWAQTVKGKIHRNLSKSCDYSTLKLGNKIGNQVFAPRDNYIRAGFFDPQMPAWQDWDLWLRMSKCSGKFFNIGKGSYILDELHDSGRVSTKNELYIRFARDLLVHKNSPLTKREMAPFVVTSMCYRHVSHSFKEWLLVLAHTPWETLAGIFFFRFQRTKKVALYFYNLLKVSGK